MQHAAMPLQLRSESHRLGGPIDETTRTRTAIALTRITRAMVAVSLSAATEEVEAYLVWGADEVLTGWGS